MLRIHRLGLLNLLAALTLVPACAQQRGADTEGDSVLLNPTQPSGEIGAAPVDAAAAPVGPVLAAVATLNGDALGLSRPAGDVALADGTLVFLFGASDAVDPILAGAPWNGTLAGVFVSQETGDCLGIMTELPRELGAGLADSGATSGAWWIGDRTWELGACPAGQPSAATLEQGSARLKEESVLVDDDGRFLAPDEEPPPPPGCTSTCGSKEGYSYAGAYAYSNASYTGTGTSCGGVGTYGYKYQCVEYPNRVHQRSDWNGNAYTGYWSNSGLTSGTQGPYYKGLLPLGNGTGRLAPQAGDVVVWSGGSYGHVGIIAAVGSSTVTVYDQNRRCGDQTCTLGYGSSYTLSNGSATGYCGAEGISSYSIAGYLHRGWDFGAYYGLSSSSTTGTSAHNWWPNDASYSGGTTSGSVTDISDYITINPGASDPYLTSPPGQAIPSDDSSYGYKYVSFRIKSACSSKAAKLYWKRTTDSSFAESRSVSATISGSDWQDLTFNVSVDSDWSGTISQIRLDPAASCSSGSSDAISIQYAWIWK